MTVRVSAGMTERLSIGLVTFNHERVVGKTLRSAVDALPAKEWRTMYCPEAVVLHEWRRDAHRGSRAMLLFCARAARYFNKSGWRLA